MKTRYTFIISLLCLFMLSGVASAQEWGEIREATLNLNVRAKRTPKSEHVVTLEKGQQVKTDFLKDGWVAVFSVHEAARDVKKAIGYANIKYLKLIKASPKQQVAPAPKAAPKAVAKPAPKPAPKPVSQAAPKSAPKQAPKKVASGQMKAEVAASPPAPVKVGVDPSRTPVKITSDRMIYNESGKTVSFVGNVVAEHGGLTLWADKLSAYLGSKSDKKFSADSIERIVAEGRVTAKQGKTEGTCGKLTYFVEKQLLKMEQDPKLQDGPNSLTGNVINFYVRENRSEVVGGQGKRVKAIFLTPDNIKMDQ